MTRTFVLLSLAVVLAAGVVHATLNPPLTDEQLADAMARLNTTTEGRGDQQTFSFISSEFGVPTTTLLQEQTQFGQTSSEIFMAHTFAEVSRTTTATQILTLREQGLNWNQISQQLGFRMPELREVFESAIARFKAQAGLTTTGTTIGGTTTGGTTTGGTTTSRTTTSGTTTTTDGTNTGGTASGTTTTGSTTTSTNTSTTSTNTSTTRTTSTNTSGTTPHAAPGVDRKITTLATRLETSAETRGDQATVERLANQFDVSTDVLFQQRTEFDADWGDLFLAYTVMDRSRRDVTLDDIFTLRDEGLSWTQIARQYRIPPGRLLQAVRSGTSVLTSTSNTTTNGGTTVRSGMGKAHMAARGSATKSTTLHATMRSGGGALKVRGSGSMGMGGSGATKLSVARATKMGGASATKMGGMSATKMGGMSATKMGGMSATRMGGASATRMGGSATRVHGNGH